jgi:hypothetical protein
MTNIYKIIKIKIQDDKQRTYTPAPPGYILFLDTSDFQEGGHTPGDAVPCKHAFGCITVSRIQYGNLQINEDYICVILC